MTTSYRDAGVDMDAADDFIDQITPLVKTTDRKEVVDSIGGFSGLFALDTQRFKNPLLVASTDGVGTKLKIAQLVGKHSSVGIDLVAMCVNDVVVTGAEPLFFLDYFATGKLDPKQGKEILVGIVEGCRQAGCSLLGGETAEMPGFYPVGEYDLAGFAVGVVERGEALGAHLVRQGDILLGLASTGLHSNGFSLVRKVLLDGAKVDLKSIPEGLNKSWGEELLTPTRIYVRLILELKKRVQLHGLAHITGSGMPGNIPRVIPENLALTVKFGQWPVPRIFQLIQQLGKVTPAEMLKTFNLGIGMVLILGPTDVDRARQVATEHGVESWPIGQVDVRRDPHTPFVLL